MQRILWYLNPAIGKFEGLASSLSAEDARHRRRRRIKILQAFGNKAGKRARETPGLVKLPIPKGVECEKKCDHLKSELNDNAMFIQYNVFFKYIIFFSHSTCRI